MDVSAPHRTLGATTSIDVLAELAQVEAPRSGRQIATRVGRSHTAVNRALEELVVGGIVLRDRHPTASYYVLNRQHLLAGAVEEMVAARSELLRRLQASIESWKVLPYHASLVGSAARGDGDADSDIDLLIVRPSGAPDDIIWQDQMDELRDSVTMWTGNEVQILPFAQEEFETALASGHDTLMDMRVDAVLLHGDRLSALARRLRRP